jgi:hypothetical protein
MHGYKNHNYDAFDANARLFWRFNKSNAPFLTSYRFGATRASWEVCPKHRNIRRENQRVRCQEGAVSFPMAWQRICSFTGCVAQPPGECSSTRSKLVPEAMPRIT